MKKSENELWQKIKTWFHRDLGIKNARLFLGLVLGLVFVLLMTDLNARLSDLNRLNNRRDELQTEVINMRETLQALETAVVYANSDAAVVDWARSEGHMKQEGDQIVVPIPPDNALPIAAATPAPTPRVPETWEVWEALFFGED